MPHPFTSRAEYEAAVELAAGYVDRAQENEANFEALVERILAHRGADPEVGRSRLDALERRIDSFSRRRAEDDFLRRDDPDGIGPILGPDVSRS